VAAARGAEAGSIFNSGAAAKARVLHNFTVTETLEIEQTARLAATTILYVRAAGWGINHLYPVLTNRFPLLV
jgi:hypothetical protein